MIEVLDFANGPLLFTAQDAGESTYVCAFLQNTDEGTQYLCTQVAGGRLNTFLHGNMDLRSLIERAPLKQYFLLLTTDDENIPLMAEPVALDSIAPELLPAENYFVPVLIEESPLIRNRTAIEASLDVPEAEREHVLSAYTLSAFLKIIQDLIKFCYKKDISKLPNTLAKKAFGLPLNYTAEVYAVAAGSFTVKLRSKAVSEDGFVEFSEVLIERGLRKVAQILQATDETDSVIAILKQNKGHLVSAYRNLLSFLIEEKGTLNLKWSNPSDRSHLNSFRITAKAASRIQKAISSETDIEEELVEIEGVLEIIDAVNQKWALQVEGAEIVRGELAENSTISLAGLIVESQRYRFKCREEIREDAIGRETKTMILLEHVALDLIQIKQTEDAEEDYVIPEEEREELPPLEERF